MEALPVGCSIVWAVPHRRGTPVNSSLLPQDMVWDLKYKTVRWGFVESLEPAQVVHVRCSGLVNQSNMYGQVTVRLHTRQVGSLFAPAFLYSV